MERTTVIPRAGPADGPEGRLEHRWLASLLIDVVLTWLERRRQRRALLKLDERMLGDIGLSRADIDREAGKPMWRG